MTVGEGWQRGQHHKLTRMARDPAAKGSAAPTTNVRALMTERLGGRPTRANFRTGTLTVCTMTPMRSVPRQCLLGVDDGVFPHVQVRMTRLTTYSPLSHSAGERDLRHEDRQLMLNLDEYSVTNLVVTYTGKTADQLVFRGRLPFRSRTPRRPERDRHGSLRARR